MLKIASDFNPDDFGAAATGALDFSAFTYSKLFITTSINS